MKRIIITALMVFVLFILDNTLMHFFAIKNYYTSLLFVFIICFSIINGRWQGLSIGIFAGVLQDMYFFNAFGINCLMNMVVCVIAGEIGTIIIKRKRFVPVISTFFFAAAKGLMIFFIFTILGQKVYLQPVFFDALYAMIVCVLIYKPIYNLYNKDKMKKEWKF